MKRILAILSCLILLVCLVASMPTAVSATTESETILLAGSDFQVSGHNTSRIEAILGTLEIHGITKADGAFFCGDYTLNSCDNNNGQSSAGLQVLKDLFNPIVGDNTTFVQGNHDPADTVGLSHSGNNDPASGKYGVYVIHEDEYLQYNWDYSLGVVEQTAARLKEYLDAKADSGWDKPIFILSHVGLHWGNRTIKEGSAIHGDLLVDVLNEAGEKGLNIIFLYGHDHSGGIADFIGGSAVYFKKGDQIEVCTGQKKEHTTRTLKFTYMNAGYIGYYSTTEPTCDATVTMSVFRIRGNEVIITRYDGNINFLKEQYGIHNLKSKGVWHPDYSQEGYHAQPNTLEYASSRRVTATSDEYVETPMPSDNHTHEYASATCTDPKTCIECGATEGEALGHKFTNACDKFCNRCSYTRMIKHDYKAATCTKAKTCKVCGKTSGSKLGHTYKKVVTKATTTANGKIKNVCTRCDYTASKVTTVYKASKVSLSKTTYTYDGKVKKPTLTVKDSKGNKIASSNYTVTYASGRKTVGTYKVTVKFKGNYSGTKTLYFKINPVKTSVKSLTAAKKSLKVAINKKAPQVSGYQVQYSTSKSFKSYKTKTLTGYKKTALTLSGLSAKKTYYVRVRTYKVVNGVRYYSGWSAVKYKKTK